MCGINGIYNPYINNNIAIEINKMNNLIIHRGPDDDGIFIEKSNYSIAMAMRRLSIIDIKNGIQPIFSHDKSKVIVFNGEIYNYKELKDNLIKKKIKFISNSDTEVIIRLYEHYGEESFKMLDGMFAFSIYDKTSKKIFLVRDYFGEKPLYYKNIDGSLVWGSELKSIIKYKGENTISTNAVRLFFCLNFIPAPFTIYNEVKKLSPNSYLTYDISSGSQKINSIKKSINDYSNSNNFKQLINRTKSLVRETVATRSLADVPLGSFLSGGVDSSIISLCMAQNSSKKIDTFSIGFENKSYDETEKSDLVSKLINSNHHKFIVNENSVKKHIDQIILNFDEPFADASSLATFILSKETKKYVKVALTGDGGDEMFGGYNRYYMSDINKFYTRFIPKNLHKYFKHFSNKHLRLKVDNRGFIFKMKKVLNSINYEKNFYWNIISLGFKEDELNNLLIENPSIDIFEYYKKISRKKFKSSLSEMRAIDLLVCLEGDMLVKVDRTSMLNSLECRSPFLSTKILDFTNSIPSGFLIKNGNKKFILKESFKEFFPENFFNLPKQGFGVPVGNWLRTNLKSELLRFSERSFIEKQGIFNYTYINSLVNNHINSIDDSTFKLWPYYCFQKWYKNIYMKL